MSSEDELHFLMGGGPLINIFLRVYFYVFRQTSRLNFCPSKQSSFFSGTEIYIPERVDTSHHLWINFTFLCGGGPLINVSLSVYFHVFRQSSLFNLRLSNIVPSFRVPKSIYRVLICAHHKTEFVFFGYRNLDTRPSRH